jgi:hypothetical protein
MTNWAGGSVRGGGRYLSKDGVGAVDVDDGRSEIVPELTGRVRGGGRRIRAASMVVGGFVGGGSSGGSEFAGVCEGRR